MTPWHEHVPERYRVAIGLFLVPVALLLALVFLNWLFPKPNRSAGRD
ncbi:MAG: hypothetical protein OXC13_02105 [Caldilineaceae bacterium]|nr:hypothetical protein [Caldilineaceae bacterium]